VRLQSRLEIRVDYDATARDCRRVLRVLPLHRGGQEITRENWQIAPDAAFALEKRDAYGNRRLLIQHRSIENALTFGLEIEAQTSGAPVLEFQPDRARWRMPTSLVVFAPEVQNLAREARELAPLARAAHFARFCFQNLEYDAQIEASPLASSQIWARKRGNCADFSHLLLALCRASGLLARYVAGLSRSQGQMHAWAEVWDDNHWHAFDPTLDEIRAARPIQHIAVAVGRDFADCAPHSGQFRGAGAAHIELWCQTREIGDAFSE